MHDGLVAWLRASAARIHEQAAALTALDQAIGDGDHGINMDRGFSAIVAMLDARPAPEDGTPDVTATADLLRQAGKTLISTVGGAAGPLYGTAFLRSAAAMAGEHPSSAATFVAGLEAAANGIAALGKATEGEKTMLDALFPASRAAREALDGGGDLAATTAAATAAADAGATATIPMLATKGRASYLGDRSIGHQDPGATSSALLLRVLAAIAVDLGLTGAMAQSILVGQPGSPGIGRGRLLWVPSESPPPPAAESAASAAAAAPDAATERASLLAALDAAAAELNALADETAGRAGEDVGAIFGAQALFATDPAIVDPALEAIDAGATAAEAIDRITSEQADRLAGVDDDYFRERAADVRDVGKRVIDRLLGRARPELYHRDGTPAVLASDDFDPSIVAVIRPELVAGLALAGGAPTGHAAIVARALGIPLVLGLGPALDSALDGADVAVDGTSGQLLVAPETEELAALSAAAAGGGTAGGAGPEAGGADVDLPVTLEANVGSVKEAEAAAAAGAQGIGLVRTELLFLGRSSPPGLEEQRSLYRRIGQALPGRPVVFRTLDIGGDKPAEYLARDPEMNPALGVRGVRLGLARPDLLETQFRALLEANPDGPLRVMLPMVAATEEVVAARAALEAAAAASRAAGAPISADVRLGIMVEIPSVAVLADAFAPIVDFFSIGTNDLVQYTLAVDRTNPGLAALATPLQPAILRLIRGVTDAAVRFGRPVAVCGEAAADPLAAALLVGLGVDELSVAPTSMARIRSVLARLDPVACREAADQAVGARSVAEVRRIAEALVAVGGVAA